MGKFIQRWLGMPLRALLLTVIPFFLFGWLMGGLDSEELKDNIKEVWKFVWKVEW